MMVWPSWSASPAGPSPAPDGASAGPHSDSGRSSVGPIGPSGGATAVSGRGGGSGIDSADNAAGSASTDDAAGSASSRVDPTCHTNWLAGTTPHTRGRSSPAAGGPAAAASGSTGARRAMSMASRRRSAQVVTPWPSHRTSPDADVATRTNDPRTATCPEPSRAMSAANPGTCSRLPSQTSVSAWRKLDRSPPDSIRDHTAMAVDSGTVPSMRAQPPSQARPWCSPGTQPSAVPNVVLTAHRRSTSSPGWTPPPTRPGHTPVRPARRRRRR